MRRDTCRGSVKRHSLRRDRVSGLQLVSKGGGSTSSDITLVQQQGNGNLDVAATFLSPEGDFGSFKTSFLRIC